MQAEVAAAAAVHDVPHARADLRGQAADHREEGRRKGRKVL